MTEDVAKTILFVLKFAFYILIYFMFLSSYVKGNTNDLILWATLVIINEFPARKQIWEGK